MKQKKNLNAKEVATLLGIPLVTVQRWVHQGKMPYKLKKDEYIFKRSEIEEWAAAHDLLISQGEKPKPAAPRRDFASLAGGIERGGIYYNLPGEDIYTVLKNGIEKIDFPEGTDRGLILNELINREEIASTGIGKGVAIPHPRSTLDLNLPEPLIPVFFLEHEVDFNSLDGKPVSLLFFMFSPDTRIHLKLLSRLSYCLRDDYFLTMIRQRGNTRDILARITEIEKSFYPDE